VKSSIGAHPRMTFDRDLCLMDHREATQRSRLMVPSSVRLRNRINRRYVSLFIQIPLEDRRLKATGRNPFVDDLQRCTVRQSLLEVLRTSFVQNLRTDCLLKIIDPMLKTFDQILKIIDPMCTHHRFDMKHLKIYPRLKSLDRALQNTIILRLPMHHQKRVFAVSPRVEPSHQSCSPMVCHGSKLGVDLDDRPPIAAEEDEDRTGLHQWLQKA